MSSKKLLASVVIPNYNGRELLQKNLPKVLEAVGKSEVIVVDDASTDDSVEFLKNNFPTVKVVVHEENKRFAASCNTGVMNASGEVVVLLNNDVVPEPGFLKPLLKHFDDDQVFAVGCAEFDGLVTSGRSGGDFRRGLFVHWRAKDQARNDTLWVSGGSGAFRKSIWDKLGGMDACFAPAYEEDRDICYRALKMGYKLSFEPKSRVNHMHETTNVRELGRTKMKVVSYRNHFLLVWKNITSKRLMMIHLLWLPYRLVVDTIRSRGLMLAGFLQAVVSSPKVCSKRRLIKSVNKVSDEEIVERFRQI